MITTLVQFQIGGSDQVEAIKQVFADSVPRYQQVPGLLRQYYLISSLHFSHLLVTKRRRLHLSEVKQGPA